MYGISQAGTLADLGSQAQVAEYLELRNAARRVFLLFEGFCLCFCVCKAKGKTGSHFGGTLEKMPPPSGAHCSVRKGTSWNPDMNKLWSP